jgi:hypothetical protein
MPTPSVPVANKRVLYFINSPDGAVLLDSDSDQMLKFNSIGAEMWIALAAGRPKLELTEAIARKYQVDVSCVSRDLDALLTDAALLGITPEIQLLIEDEASTDEQHGESFPWYGQDGSKARPEPPRLAALSALAGLAVFDFILSALSFKFLCSAVKAWPVKPKSNSDPDLVGRICAAVEKACVWYPKKALCLQRSAVTACMLRRWGIQARMVVGVRPMPFLAHAWVEANGSVVNDFPKVKKFYRTISSY